MLREARAVPDLHAGRGGHVFLVPHDGAAAITAVHDRLYEGPLAPHLRRDLPFIPHITIAADSDLARCEELAATLAVPPIRGELRALTLVDVHPTGVRPLSVHPLAT